MLLPLSSAGSRPTISRPSRHRFTRTLLLGATLAAPMLDGTTDLAQAATAKRTSTLQRTVEAMTQEPAVARAHWGISVTRLDGTPILAINDGQYFQPASNAKLFTTAAAMALLPIDARLSTRVVAGSLPVDGVLDGDLQLVGAGDANLSGRPVPYRTPVPGQPEPPVDELRYIAELADKVRATGVTTVRGDVVGDDSLFPWDPYPSDWAIDDMPWYYGAPVNALMLADNAVTLTVTPGQAAGDSAMSASTARPTATLDPPLPFYTIDMQATTSPKGSETLIDIERGVGSRVVQVYGHIAADAKPYLQGLSIAEPAEYAAMALKAALEQRGISISGTARAKHTVQAELAFTKAVMEPLPSLTALPILRYASMNGPISDKPTADIPLPKCSEATDHHVPCTLAEHLSPTLYEDVVVTNKVSQNQHAEVFLRQLGLFLAAGGTAAQGARVVRSFLTTKAHIDPQDFVFYDGSGLSGHDLVTPRATTQLLRYGATQPWGARWKASLPIGGIDGSLRERFANAPLKNHIFAKTGTLGEARALSGYLDCASGQTLVFSIMVSTHTPLDKEDQKVMDRIVAAIAAAE